MKVLKAVVKVIGVVATVLSFIPGPWQPIAMIVASAAALVSAALEVAAPSRPKGSTIGSQTEITLDPQAGEPYLIGRTYYAGKLVHQDTFGSDNKFIGSVIVYSGGGPINSVEGWQVDRVAVSFSGGAAVGANNGFLWLDHQLGACPESNALASSQGSLPNWGSSYKLSGKAGGLWTLKFDKEGKKWGAGYPQTGGVFEGVLVYDPRLDDTYPGGSGDCRSDDESTFVYSENPGLHGITWALGRYQNGERVIGVGEPVDGIDMPRWVEFANTCDDNGWKVGGVVSSEDDKWDVLKMICQAGGGAPMRIGGLLSVDFQAPRVSLATITSADLWGEASAPRYKRRRERYNTVIPRYRSEDHGWEVIAGDPVGVADYVTADGGTITRELDYPLVQDLDQVAELATYEIAETREFGPIALPLKTLFIGYKPGDCLTIDVPELLPDPQDAVVTGRALDADTAVATLTLKSETGSKHDLALGTVGSAPAPVDLDPGDPPTVLDWPFIQTNLLIQLSGPSGLVVEALDDAGEPTISINDHTRLYADKNVSLNAADIAGGLSFSVPGDPVVYGVYYDDEERAGGAVSYGATTTLTDAVNSADYPFRHFLAIVEMPISGGSSTIGVGGAPGGGSPIGPGGNVPEY